MIYLDNSATTKPLKEVLDTFLQVNELYYANPASIHEAGVEANMLLTRARGQIATVLKTEEKNVIFTSGGTESNNFAIFGIAKTSTHKGKHILTTEIEHPAVLEAVKRLADKGFEVDYLKVDAAGVISLDELRAKVRKDTILVSIMLLIMKWAQFNRLRRRQTLFMQIVAQYSMSMRFKALVNYRLRLMVKRVLI